MNQDISLFVVVQLGGSSEEYYLHSFTDANTAQSYIEKAAQSSYRCLGPMRLELPEIAEMCIAARDLLNSLPTSLKEALEPASRLNHLVEKTEKEFQSN